MKINNPLFQADMPDPEIVSYICREIADNEIYRMENGRHAYAKGQWATSLMRYRDRFYACFVCHDMKKTYLFSTDDIEKSGWDKTEMDGVGAEGGCFRYCGGHGSGAFADADRGDAALL